MRNSELFRALKAIQAKDPDGGNVMPTDEMYEAHKDWAIRTYGPKVWEAYSTDSWDESDELY